MQSHDLIVTVDIPIKFNYVPEESPITHLSPENCSPGSPAEIEWWIPKDIELFSDVNTTVIKQIEDYIHSEKEKSKIDHAEYIIENRKA